MNDRGCVRTLKLVGVLLFLAAALQGGGCKEDEWEDKSPDFIKDYPRNPSVDEWDRDLATKHRSHWRQHGFPNYPYFSSADEY